MEEAVALTATANTIIQDADVVGTALKTVSMRLRGTDTKEMEEEGIETDGVITSKSKLQTKIKGLAGVDILTDDGAYKSTYQILSEIADVWKDINDMDQAALLELLAGKRAGSVMSAILQNPETLKEAFESASEASGSALEENETYLDSIQGKMDVFTNAVQTMWKNTFESEMMKSLISLGTELIKIIDKIGLIQSLLIAISTYAMVKHKMGPISFFAELIGLIPKAVKGMQNWMTKARQNDVNTVNSIKTKMADIAATKADTKANIENAESNFVASSAEDKDTASTTANIAITEADTLKTGINTGANVANSGSNITKVDFKTGKIISNGVGSGAMAGGGTGTGLLASLAPALPYILAATAVIAVIAIAYAKFHKSAEDLKEELKDLETKTENTRSKIDSLNSELETTRERIAELETLPSLSFVDQEELEELRRQNEELELSLELQKKLLNIQEKAEGNKREEVAKSLWYGTAPDGSTWDKSYYVTPEGVIEEDHWYTVGQTAPEAIDAAVKKYKAYTNAQQIRDDLIRNLDDYSDEEIVSKMEEFNAAVYSVGGNFINPTRSRDDLKQILADTDYTEEISYVENSIDNLLGSEEFAELTYGDDTKINSLKNELLTKTYEWDNIKGGSSDSEAIALLFGPGATKEMKQLEEDIQDIMDTDDSWEKKNELIKEHLDGIDETAKGYEHLKLVLSSDELNVTKQSIADYFTLKTGQFDPNTVEGIIAQYQVGSEILEQFKHTLNDTNTERMKKLQEGGSVDLFNRPQIDASKLSQAGWEDTGDDIATVFSSTFSNEDGSIAMNFTPILPNGEVLSPSELEKYAGEVIAGTRKDDLNLKIGATFEGENAVQQASQIAEEIHDLQESYYMGEETIKINNIEYDWDEMFEKNEQGEFEARADKFGEILKEVDDEVRETFIDVAESVKNGGKGWNEAIASFNISGILATTKVLEKEWAEVNKNVFKGIDEEVISGWIDTFSELSAALEDVASSMDLLYTAQQQMNNSGRISIKTALELIETTDNWEKILTITGDTITLNKDAEDQLVQSKLNVIKAQVEEALGAVELQLAQLGAADSAYAVALASDVSDEAYEQYTNAMNSYSAAIAGFGAALDALLDRDPETHVFSSFRQAYETAKKVTDASADKTTINREELEQQRKDLQAQKDILEQGGDVSGFKYYYDYDEKPGDRWDADGSEAASEAFQKAMDYWENRIAANQARYDQIQSEIDLIEKQGGIVGEEYYQEQIKLENERLKLLEAQKAEAQKYLKTFAEGSDEWWEAASKLNEIEGEIDSATASIQDLHDAMADIDWQIFDEIHERYGTLIDDLETIRTLTAPNGEEDWFDDEGQWTEDGVAVLGTYIQQAEMYKNALDEVNKKLQEYNKAYAGNEEYYKKLGIDSEQELYDAREKLIEQQHEYAKGISDSEQAVVDMYESQINAIEEYTNELVDSYNEYIDVVREALDAERDLYEFKKDVEKQAKDIAAIERRIASLSGSTDASDIAERRKLEAELYEAKEGLDDTYYDHAKDAQQEALDDEASAYEESLTNYIETLREKLDEAKLNMDLFMQEVTTVVTINAETVLNKYTETGISIDTALTTPWKNAADAMKGYETDSLALMNLWTQAGATGYFYNFQQNATNQLKSPWSAGTSAVNTFKNDVATAMSNIVSTITSNVATAKSQLSGLYSQIQDTSQRASSVGSSSGSGSGSGGSGSSGSSGGGGYNNGGLTTAQVKELQTHLGVTADGMWGANSQAAAQRKWGVTSVTDAWTKYALQKAGNVAEPVVRTPIKSGTVSGVSVTGLDSVSMGNDDCTVTLDGKKYNVAATVMGSVSDTTSNTLNGYFGGQMPRVGTLVMYNQQLFVVDETITGRKWNTFSNKGDINALKTAYYNKLNGHAKGTLGTKRDEWAITDESWIGEEITLAAGKHGQLQYLKKGSAVMPADISANLIEWGKLDPNALSMPTMGGNVNIMSNAVIQPSYEFNFDSLVHVDHCDEGTLKGLEKMVDNKLDYFSKQLNYSIKKFAR